MLPFKSHLEALAQKVGCRIDLFDDINSTNDQAHDLQYESGSVVIAESQSAGRGQRGNVWSSAYGLNLTFSVVLCPDIEVSQQFYISKVVALSVADTLSALGITPQIKWPNDIYVDGNKVAGILIENDICGSLISRSIVGIGLNVNQTSFDPMLPNPTSIALVLSCEQEEGTLHHGKSNHETLDRGEIFEIFYLSLSRRYGQLLDTETTKIDTNYTDLLYRLNEEHLFIEGGSHKQFRGSIIGVLPSGELEVRHQSGVVKRYLFKEIEYIL